ANGWIDGVWLSVIAVALSLSCGIAAGVNSAGDRIYMRYRTAWNRLQRRKRLADDRLLDTGGATILILGMGRVGTGAYEAMQLRRGETVVGVDIDPRTVENHQSAGLKVLLGDPSDADFWDRIRGTNTIELVMLALPNLSASLAVLNQIRAASFRGRVAATARFHDEIEPLERAGASVVFNVYEKAGAGFAALLAGQDTTAPVSPRGIG
ncbi:MAG: NAD-binding protein, partial [Acidobacteriota bacterium]|nr:NAD-binding protein [Acidobacteriota bacterium]